MGDEQQEGHQDPAALAFNALQDSVEKLYREVKHHNAELSVTRRVVENLPEALAHMQPPDYTKSYKDLSDNIRELQARLKTIEEFPALKRGAEHFATIIKNAGEEKFEQAIDVFKQYGQGLAGITRSARTLDEQNATLKRSRIWFSLLGGILGAVVGAAALLFGAQLLGKNSRIFIAQTIAGDQAWDIGEDMMRGHNPGKMRDIMNSYYLMEDSLESALECYSKAKDTRTPQKCEITIKPPSGN